MILFMIEENCKTIKIMNERSCENYVEKERNFLSDFDDKLCCFLVEQFFFSFQFQGFGTNKSNQL